MQTQIKYTNEQGKTIIAWGAQGFTAAQIAEANNFPDGTWQEVSREEAGQIQARVPAVDQFGIYTGTVQLEKNSDGDWHPPAGITPAQFEPPSDEPGKWLQTGDGWQELDLDGLKQFALDILKQYRQRIEAAGFSFAGQTWDSEQKDEVRLNSAYRLFEELGLTEYPGWKVADGLYVTLTLDMLRQASAALMQHYGHAFRVEQAKQAEINALTDQAAVRAWLRDELKRGWGEDESAA